MDKIKTALLLVRASALVPLLKVGPGAQAHERGRSCENYDRAVSAARSAVLKTYMPAPQAELAGWPPKIRRKPDLGVRVASSFCDLIPQRDL